MHQILRQYPCQSSHFSYTCHLISEISAATLQLVLCGAEQMLSVFNCSVCCPTERNYFYISIKTNTTVPWWASNVIGVRLNVLNLLKLLVSSCQTQVAT